MARAPLLCSAVFWDTLCSVIADLMKHFTPRRFDDSGPHSTGAINCRVSQRSMHRNKSLRVDNACLPGKVETIVCKV